MDRVVGLLMTDSNPDLDSQYETLYNAYTALLERCNTELLKQNGADTQKAHILQIDGITGRLPTEIDEFTDDQMLGAIHSASGYISFLQKLHDVIAKENSDRKRRIEDELAEAELDERHEEMQKIIQRGAAQIERNNAAGKAEWRKRTR